MDFLASMLQQESPRFAFAGEVEFKQQQQAYRDLHLSLVLVDYWLYLARPAGEAACAAPGATQRAEWFAGVRSIAASRRLPEMHGEEMFERVVTQLEGLVFGNI